MSMSRLTLVLAIDLALIGQLQAHEFWIEPLDYTISAQDKLQAHLRVGEKMIGSKLPFFERDFTRFEIANGDETAAVTGRLGDRPALSYAPQAHGLHVIIHQTTSLRVTYTDFEKFKRFVAHKDFKTALADHAARGLPETAFSEAYSRYAKSLVAVGEGKGADHAVGLETEIIALENPYTDDVSNGLDIRLEYRGQPRPDAQIEIFSRSLDDRENEAEVTTTRTDENGVATIPVTQGREYLLDAVILREPSPQLAKEKDAVWESIWASLTFAVE